MNLFLTLAFLFLIGSVLGWGLEVIFRRFFSAHHWVNPGFLVGPYLPLYGSSLCVLYLLAMLESLMPVENPLLKKIMLFVVMALAITALEYVAGLIFIRGMKIKLWDYSDRWGNIQGIICPLFTFFWMVLSAVYYFLIHPHILNALHWLAENLAFLWDFSHRCRIFHTPDGKDPRICERNQYRGTGGRTAGGHSRCPAKEKCTSVLLSHAWRCAGAGNAGSVREAAFLTGKIAGEVDSPACEKSPKAKRYPKEIRQYYTKIVRQTLFVRYCHKN